MYKTHFNSKPTKGQYFKKPSQTIQGQTMTVAQMLERINNGMPITYNQNLEWSDDEEPLPRIKDLTDLDEIKEYVNSVKDKIATLSKVAEEPGNVAKEE